MDEYDFSNIKEPFVPKLALFKKNVRFFIYFIIFMNVVILLTRRELTYDIAIAPLFTIFAIAFTYWHLRRLTNKISIDDSKIKIEQGEKAIKVNWRDIEDIYVRRNKLTGFTTMKIKLSNPDIKLPRTTFKLYVGAGSREGKIKLAELLNNIENFTILKCNKTIQNDVKKWGNRNSRSGTESS